MEPARKLSLSHQRQRLIETLQRINFGKIERIPFRDGQPELSDASKVFREHKFRSESGPNRHLATEDFAIKRQLVELFHYFDEQVDGEIELLEVQNGLPFRMTVIESAA
ncbi:hypothetical protein SV7mr_50300 [Stieleria bergensis]|uniref:Uncharacterized protein n=1 Tax=Stieleria bergensis TaxID=2528025 RepID=A0A517T296_9BACT|nr:hypothetical protein SV7mr_50300 [Planctomycetes bacterium SV_7m_r]